LEAERAAEIRLVALVIKAAADDPRHAEWWLARKFPGRWADRSRVRADVAVAGRGGGPVEVRGFESAPADTLLEIVRLAQSASSAKRATEDKD
jgi:hypothetical protein